MELRVTTSRTLVVLIYLGISSYCVADKLSPGQKAPLFAKGSGGLALQAPLAGPGALAADVGQRRVNPAPPAAPSGSAPRVEGVVREETEELKEVDGQLVRVVKGNFAYDSPEGLPIAVKYVADENGNRASFTFGTASQSGGGRPTGGMKKPGLTPGGPGATSLTGGNGGGTKNGRPPGAGGPGGPSAGSRPSSSGSRPGGGNGGASTYLPPAMKVDRSYLPPN